ncbi:hypothetical protein B296_00001887 [Ensete ventricosum]|uniref:Uncharacterized protein n=1 Tax=Ensete ventricosum TaxID=4639 RepID=A0A427AZL0_ENSVE|nr:hypothetical protein B296_00001887 [Ensete ventricosum]
MLLSFHYATPVRGSRSHHWAIKVVIIRDGGGLVISGSERGPFQIELLFAENEARFGAPQRCLRPSLAFRSFTFLKTASTYRFIANTHGVGEGMAARNGRWQPAPPPVPMILNLPRRTRRTRASAPPKPGLGRNLRDLMDEERSARPPEPVPSCSSGESAGVSEAEDGWRFQAEILRAECNFLRMEREVAQRKMERNRAQMEDALKSAMESLASGRKKIDGSDGVGAALDEGIEQLKEKLEQFKLGSSGSRRRRSSRKLLRRSCRGNFDRRASVLRRKLEKMTEDTSVKDIQEIFLPSLPKKAPEVEQQEQAESATPDSNHGRQFPDDMERLRRKMEGMSRGMLERMEECSYLLSANNRNNSSTSSSSHKIVAYSEAAGNSVLHLRQKQQPPQEKLGEKEKMGLVSCCSCKEAVGRIMQQVRADLAVTLVTLLNQKLEWKQRARSSERKVTELEKLVSELQKELQPSKGKLLNPPTASPPLHLELRTTESRRAAKDQQMRSLNSCKEEKRVLVHQSKSHNHFTRRSPLQNIDNIFPLRPRK